MNEIVERLTRLEIEVLVACLTAHHDRRVRDLFNIIPLLRVKAREYTGVGFYTKFTDYPHSAASKELSDQELKKFPPEAVGFHPDLDGVVNFLVWMDEGRIDCLEAASTSSWPENEADFVISAFPK